jgi:hypothetical protein
MKFSKESAQSTQPFTFTEPGPHGLCEFQQFGL